MNIPFHLKGGGDAAAALQDVHGLADEDGRLHRESAHAVGKLVDLAAFRMLRHADDVVVQRVLVAAQLNRRLKEIDNPLLISIQIPQTEIFEFCGTELISWNGVHLQHCVGRP